MSKHTPGPWMAVDLTDAGFTATVSTDIYAGDTRVASVTLRSDLPVEANARLVAAAPELLESMKAFLYEFEQVAASRSFADLLPPMRAAIAKAEGKVRA